MTEAQNENIPPHGIKVETPAQEYFTPELVLILAACVAGLFVLAWMSLMWRQRRRKSTAAVSASAWETLSKNIRSLGPSSDETYRDREAALAESSEVNLMTRQLVGFLTSEPCEDWTTEEFVAFFRDHWDLGEIASKDEVIILLRQTDEVRFADRGVTREQMLKWQSFLKELLNKAEIRRASQTPSSEVPSKDA